MKMITLELTFKNDEDYFKFMDDWGVVREVFAYHQTVK